MTCAMHWAMTRRAYRQANYRAIHQRARVAVVCGWMGDWRVVRPACLDLREGAMLAIGMVVLGMVTFVALIGFVTLCDRV